MSTSYRRIATHELDASLIDAWRSIQRASPHLASPYFCPEFTQLVAGVRHDVGLVLIEEDSRPVGFFPFQRSRGGLGRPVGGPLSDYHGPIVGRTVDCDLKRLMRAARLSVWNFDHAPAAITALQAHARSHADSPVIDLSAGYDAYAHRFRESGSDYVSRAQRMARKIEREVGPLTFSLHEFSEQVIRQLCDWKDAQYLASKTVAVFRDHAWTGALLRAIARTQGEFFSGVCSVLRAGSRVAAVHLGMRAGAVLHWWFPTYDVALESYSPGTLLLLRVAQACQAAGIRVIDLGKGDSRYKRTAMTGSVPLLEGAIELPSLLTHWFRIQRGVEARAAGGGVLARVFDVPARVLRHRAHFTKFR